MKDGLLTIASGALAFIAMCGAVAAIVICIKFIWQDSWQIPWFRSASNDEIIEETHKCEEAGLGAYPTGSLFHTGGIACYPKKENQ